jgi:hypothetical protein
MHGDAASSFTTKPVGYSFAKEILEDSSGTKLFIIVHDGRAIPAPTVGAL